MVASPLMINSMPVKPWTKRESWKQEGNRGTNFHAHPFDNFSGGEDKAEAKSFVTKRRRQHQPSDESLASKQLRSDPEASRTHFIAGDDEESGLFDDFDVHHLIPAMKLNVLHHRHASGTTTNGTKVQLPLQHQGWKSHNKRGIDGQILSRGSIPSMKRSLLHYCPSPPPIGNGRIRRCFVFGIAVYFLIMVIQSQLLFRQTRISMAGPPPMLNPRNLNERIKFQARWTTHEKARLVRELSERTTERKRRTTPPQLSTSTSVPNYDILTLEDEEAPIGRSARAEAQRPANINELCGLHAQESALANPYSYLSRDALSTKARVVITGILNPVGFHLALALKERCGVESIIGIDPMFPNTVANRLYLLEQMKVLATNIPQLVQPITLPMAGLDPRLRKRDPLSSITLLNSTGELNMLSSQPTHIVHLASYAPDMYIRESLNKEWRNRYSPYVNADRNPPMYRLQSSAASMEQILASLSTADVYERPHFTYGSITQHEGDPTDGFQTCSKQMDDILVDTYHSVSGTFAVGLRFPNAVYGPWARAGNVVYDLAQSLITNWNSSVADQETPNANVTESQRLDLLYVEDLVDAIIAAMQFRSESSSPVILDVTSGSTTPLPSLKQMIKSLKNLGTNDVSLGLPSQASPSALSFQQYIQWKPQTTLRDGILKTIAWQLDRFHPYGKPINAAPVVSGDEFLTLHGVSTCSADDILCNSGHKYLPCISECASKTKCTPSIFQDIVEIARDISAGCDIVMYTQSLGRDVEDLNLHVKYIDNSSPQICNLAFVPRDSKLVDTVVRKVPSDQLVKFGVAQQPGETAGDGTAHERKLDGLNGNLLYRGWILIWVKDATSKLSPSDDSMLKITPGRFFSKDVKSAVFVDQTFSVSPTVDDITFLFDELSRSPLKRRAAYQTVKNGKAKQKVKYILAAEPARSAAILVSKLKVPKDESLPRDKKLSVYDAAKFMRAEMGTDEDVQESPELQRQREFYDRIPSFMNQHDLRSSIEPLYYYDMKHWIRSRWVVHNIRIEDSRQLRCEWYQEHLLWGAELDQLSFAHVMATIELKRKIAHNEPDDHTKPAFVEHPELLALLDAHEWHALNTERRHVQISAAKKVPDHLVDAEIKDDGDELDFAAAKGSKDSISVQELPVVSVRIMSESAMAMSRAIWMQTKWQREKG